jgi:hypothetical protein
MVKVSFDSLFSDKKANKDNFLFENGFTNVETH